MRAIDTNIVVRFLAQDDAQQAQQARRVFEAGDVFIGTTVALETEWVLRAGYGFSGSQVAEALRAIGGLPGVSLEDPAQLSQALDWLVEGMDFADALHLARSADCSVFVTFDKKLARAAKGRSPLAIKSPQAL